ncbi:hypothetical protein KXS00_16860 [Olivibacter jilunii]|jgi:hypothetical protein|uniref:DUF2116 family Zn-ribbon domain-containing protein n=2 Tax=Sphingobacteriaceae TaxID=84566 RepID=F4C313_SPHS2|nr:hypothetical protein FKG96_23410 [Olivibacter sp. LS-1]
MNRFCLDCQEPLIGRSDKKFCNDACRSNFNNKLKTQDQNYVRRINAILKRNRRIIMDLNPNGMKKVLKEDLSNMGFDFKHYTHILNTAKGSRYFFCYEFGYLFIKQDEVLLVKNESLLNQ